MSDRLRPSAPNLVRAAVRQPTRVILGAYVSEGLRMLWAFVADHCGGRADKLAHKLPDLDRSAVHWHLYGDRRPDRTARGLYLTVCGVPEEAWDIPPTEPFRLPALVAFAKTALVVLRGAGPDGLEIGQLGKACAFARDDAEADFLAVTVIYALREEGLVARVSPRSARWHLTRTGAARARRAA